MFAPIITKDMELFPTQPLSNNIKNVRSRERNLQDRPSKKLQINYDALTSGNQRMQPILHTTRLRTKPRTSSTLSRNLPKLDAILEGVELQSKRTYANDCYCTTSSSSSSSVLSDSLLDSLMTSSEVDVSVDDEDSKTSILSAPAYVNTAKYFRRRFFKLVAGALKFKTGRRAVIFGKKNPKVSCPRLSPTAKTT